jgi:protein-S-isoprenylcysteine O-methyltransferase Ste14
VFGVFWVLNLAVRICFGVQARGTGISFARHEWRTKFLFRLLQFIYLFMLIYVFSTWVDFAHIPFSKWVRWFLGGAILAAYLALFAWAHYALGRNWSRLPEIHQDQALVMHGPYRYVRHPMYAAFFLSGIGIFLLSANWFIGAVYSIPMTLMYLDRVSVEEEMMIERFGESYREYMKKTGRLLPRFSC